jgi:hypothetical protein
VAPQVHHTSVNPAVVGVAAAADQVRNQLSLGTGSGAMVPTVFNNMLRPPLVQAYAAAKRLKAQVFKNAQIFFKTDADVFAYRPTDDVIAAAKKLNMPTIQSEGHADNLIGKLRSRADFGASDSQTGFYIATDHMDGAALKSELNEDADARIRRFDTVRQKLSQTAKRLTPLTSSAKGGTHDGHNITSQAFDGSSRLD